MTQTEGVSKPRRELPLAPAEADLTAHNVVQAALFKTWMRMNEVSGSALADDMEALGKRFEDYVAGHKGEKIDLDDEQELERRCREIFAN